MSHLFTSRNVVRALVGVCALALVGSALAQPTGTTKLWYKQPAQMWTEALPVGNGRLGAMVFSGIAEERLQLNEDTLWSGHPRDYANPDAVNYLPEIRRLLIAGEQKKAEELAMEKFMSVPLRQQMYQPLGDLWLKFSGYENATDYRRELDLTRAVVTTRYRVEKTQFTRETFSSFPHQVLVHRIAANQPGRVTISIRLSSPQEGYEVEASGNRIALRGKVTNGGLPFAAELEVLAVGGTVASDNGELRVSGADSVTLLFAAATAFKRFDDIGGDAVARAREYLAKLETRSFDALLAAHETDYRKLFSRVSIDLGTSDKAELATDERLAVSDKREDPALAALLFNYGRYLLIASSRPGTQAANLQGIWNHHLVPPWGSKYTTNINAEMNYWPAEVANISECHEPLFQLIEEVRETGRRVAQAHYGAPGWVLHHNTDLWRGAAPINHSNHGIWPTGGAWLCQHLWERYRFTGDRAFLERAYPTLKEASEFFVATLQRDGKTGWLISGPSNSPEHGGLVMGPTMDHQIIRGLFEWTAESARILNRDAEFARTLDTMRAQIAPNQIGRHGQLQEWLEDLDDPKNQHRHVSHLWGVFPGEEINWNTPDLMKAARQSLVYRGDGGTGWSLGWKISLWARFLDGDHAHRVLMNQLNFVRETPTNSSRGPGGTYPNLFDAHPPFQIDGNFAATAGIAEMLVQSHLGKIDLLPALPGAWPTGSVKGLRARGGHELDLAWREGKLASLTVRSTQAGPVRLSYRGREVEFTAKAGGEFTVGPTLQVLQN